ncbi:hypothetical protein ACYG9R_26050 [Mesorhizobium sp. RSR565B]|uniref:hypothetical protein n=1 Tax=unclassified Mesorhizobium TaxID=325217 RepID=UPI0012DE852F|nr:hypothetical protein [Mesorhizobium sp. L103C565B0]
MTDTYPELRAESLIIDPDAELEDGCVVVAMFGGGHPQTMSWRNNHGRGYGGRFAAKGSLHETFLLDSMVCGRGPSSCIRILGRVFGYRRRFPRYRTWNDPVCFSNNLARSLTVAGFFVAQPQRLDAGLRNANVVMSSREIPMSLSMSSGDLLNSSVAFNSAFCSAR